MSTELALTPFSSTSIEFHSRRSDKGNVAPRAMPDKAEAFDASLRPSRPSVSASETSLVKPKRGSLTSPGISSILEKRQRVAWRPAVAGRRAPIGSRRAG